MFPGHSVERSGEARKVKYFGLLLAVIAVLTIYAHRAGAEAPLPPGLILQDRAPGEGTPVETGKLVSVHYVGRLADGKTFDESHAAGRPPFVFVQGVTRLLPGWTAGVAGMRPGGRRIVTIPPSLAYGTDGVRGAIPASAMLVYEITVDRVE